MDNEISPPPGKRRKVIKYEADIDDTAMRDKRHLSVFSWNINGIQPFLPPSTAPITSFFKPTSQNSKGRSTDPSEHLLFHNPLRAFLKRHHWPEILFLQEVKISPSDQDTPRILLSTVNNASLVKDEDDTPSSQTRYTVHLNLPRDRFNARGFGGKVHGLGTLVREDFARQRVSCIRHADWDLEGRVTIVEERLRVERDNVHVEDVSPSIDDLRLTSKMMEAPLALVNVYAVNGTTNPYRSPDTGKVTGTRHDHKLAFHRCLRDECLVLERRGFQVVIAGDLNIARGSLDGWPRLRTFPQQHSVNRAHFNSLFFGAGDNARAESYLGQQDADVTTINQSIKSDDHESNDDDDAANSSSASTLGVAPALGSFFDGVDVFRALHGRRRKYTCHPPREGEPWGASCDRVDLIITSRRLHESGRVLATDILDSPQERGTSDHVPLWVRIRY